MIRWFQKETYMSLDSGWRMLILVGGIRRPVNKWSFATCLDNLQRTCDFWRKRIQQRTWTIVWFSSLQIVRRPKKPPKHCHLRVAFSQSVLSLWVSLHKLLTDVSGCFLDFGESFIFAELLHLVSLSLSLEHPTSCFSSLALGPVVCF